MLEKDPKAEISNPKLETAKPQVPVTILLDEVGHPCIGLLQVFPGVHPHHSVRVALLAEIHHIGTKLVQLLVGLLQVTLDLVQVSQSQSVLHGQLFGVLTS